MAKTRSVLIMGGSGFVGTQLALRLRDRYKVFACYYTQPIRIPGVSCVPMKVDDRDWAKRIAYNARPDAIIYAAGSNDMNRAEADPRVTESAHVGGPAVIADVADILQPKFIYLSNCLVFDGMKGNYHESDTVLPSTALGKAKVGGENFVKGRCINHMVLRSGPLIGRGNGFRLSFLDHLRIALEQGRRVELPHGDLYNFVPIGSLIDVLVKSIEGGLRNKTFHHGGLAKLTYYEFARQFAIRFGYSTDLISPLPAPTQKRDYSLNVTQSIQHLKAKALLLEECFDLVEQDLIAARPLDRVI